MSEEKINVLGMIRRRINALEVRDNDSNDDVRIDELKKLENHLEEAPSE